VSQQLQSGIKKKSITNGPLTTRRADGLSGIREKALKTILAKINPPPTHVAATVGVLTDTGRNSKISAATNSVAKKLSPASAVASLRLGRRFSRFVIVSV